MAKEMANLLHFSCLENPMDRGAWQATVHGDAQSWTALGDLVQHKEYLREEVPA